MPGSIEVDLTCPRCGHVWTQPLDDAAKLKVIVYRGEKQRLQEFRVRCPQCDYKWVITVALPEDDK